MNAPQELDIEIRRGKVLDLQIGGKSYRQIAELLGVSLGTVASDMKALVERTKDENDDRAEREKMLSLIRSGKAIGVLMPLVEVGDFDAMDRLDKFEKRRAALLGLDAPVKQHLDAVVSSTEVSPAAAARLVQERFGKHAAKRDSESAPLDPGAIPGEPPGA